MHNPRCLECKYDIFRRIGVEDLNYKVVLAGDVIQTRQALHLAQLKAEKDGATASSDDESDSDLRGHAADIMKPETAVDKETEEPMFLGADEAPTESPIARGNVNPNFIRTAQANTKGIINRQYTNGVD